MRNENIAWEKPAPGVFKLNVCSSCEGSGIGAGLGIVARDDTGHLLQSWAVVKDGVTNPVVAEMEVVRAALLVAQQNRWQDVEIQVDIKAPAMWL